MSDRYLLPQRLREEQLSGQSVSLNRAGISELGRLQHAVDRLPENTETISLADRRLLNLDGEELYGDTVRSKRTKAIISTAGGKTPEEYQAFKKNLLDAPVDIKFDYGTSKEQVEENIRLSKSLGGRTAMFLGDFVTALNEMTGRPFHEIQQFMMANVARTLGAEELQHNYAEYQGQMESQRPDAADGSWAAKSIEGVSSLAGYMAPMTAMAFLPGGGILSQALISAEGAGQALKEMDDFGIEDDAIKYGVAIPAGLIYGWIERIQLGHVAPALNKVMSKSIKKSLTKFGANRLSGLGARAGKELFGKHGARLGKALVRGGINVASESLEEGAQELTLAVATNMAAAVSDSIHNGELSKQINWTEDLKKSWDEVVQSIVPMAQISILGHFGGMLPRRMSIAKYKRGVRQTIDGTIQAKDASGKPVFNENGQPVMVNKFLLPGKVIENNKKLHRWLEDADKGEPLKSSNGNPIIVDGKPIIADVKVIKAIASAYENGSKVVTDKSSGVDIGAEGYSPKTTGDGVVITSNQLASAKTVGDAYLIILNNQNKHLAQMAAQAAFEAGKDQSLLELPGQKNELNSQLSENEQRDLIEGQDDNITAQENQDGAEDTTPNEYETLEAMTPDERAEYNRAQFGDDVPLDADGFVLEQGEDVQQEVAPEQIVEPDMEQGNVVPVEAEQSVELDAEQAVDQDIDVDQDQDIDVEQDVDVDQDAEISQEDAFNLLDEQRADNDEQAKPVEIVEEEQRTEANVQPDNVVKKVRRNIGAKALDMVTVRSLEQAEKTQDRRNSVIVKAARAWKNQFMKSGGDIFFFNSNNKNAPDGYQQDGDIYINESIDPNYQLRMIGHEGFHKAKRENQKLWADSYVKLRNLLSKNQEFIDGRKQYQEAYARYIETLEAQELQERNAGRTQDADTLKAKIKEDRKTLFDLDDMSDAALDFHIEEFLADRVGLGVEKSKTWEEALRENPTMIEEIIEVLKKMVEAIKDLTSIERRNLVEAIGIAEKILDASAKADAKVESKAEVKAVAEVSGNERMKLSVDRAVDKNSTDKSLVAVHNLSESKYRGAMELGALPVPSIAIIDVNKSNMTNYGAITLVADKDLVDPRKAGNKAKVYNADAYSARKPETKNKYTKADIKIITDMFEKYSERMGYGDEHIVDLLRDINNEYGSTLYDVLSRSKPMINRFNAERGIKNPTSKEAQRDAVYQEGYREWVDKVMEDIESKLSPEKLIYKGIDNMGRPKWIPATLENIVKLMTKKTLNSEGFNYGAGNIRALMSRQFKSIKDIQDSKNEIVSSEQFEAVKTEINDEYYELVSSIQEKAGKDSSYNIGENTVEAFAEGGRENASFLKSTYGDKLDGIAKDVYAFLGKLSHVPTEYFEAKINRAVFFDEFKSAIVPSDISKDIETHLKDSGIKVHKYEARNDVDRKAVLQKATSPQTHIRFSFGQTAMDIDKTGLDVMAKKQSANVRFSPGQGSRKQQQFQANKSANAMEDVVKEQRKEPKELKVPAKVQKINLESRSAKHDAVTIITEKRAKMAKDTDNIRKALEDGQMDVKAASDALTALYNDRMRLTKIKSDLLAADIAEAIKNNNTNLIYSWLNTMETDYQNALYEANSKRLFNQSKALNKKIRQEKVDKKDLSKATGKYIEAVLSGNENALLRAKFYRRLRTIESNYERSKTISDKVANLKLDIDNALNEQQRKALIVDLKKLNDIEQGILAKSAVARRESGVTAEYAKILKDELAKYFWDGPVIYKRALDPINEKVERGEPLTVKEQKFLNLRNVNSMGLGELQALQNNLVSIRNTGESIRQSQKNMRIKMHMANGKVFFEQVPAKIAEKGKKGSRIDINSDKKDILKNMGATTKNIMLNFRLEEALIEMLGGYRKDAISTRTLFDPMWDAWVAELRGLETHKAELNRLVEPLNIEKNGKSIAHKAFLNLDAERGIVADDKSKVSIPLTLSNMMWVYANSLNVHNMMHLISTFEDNGKYTEAQAKASIKLLNDMLPAENKSVVDKYMDFTENTMYPRMNAVYRELYGNDMEFEKNYFAITTLDRDKGTDYTILEEGFGYTNKNAKRGMMKGRTGSDIAFVEMGDFFKSITYTMFEHEHTIAYTIPIRNTREFINRPEFKHGVKTHGIEAEMKIINKWVNDLAYGKIVKGDMIQQAFEKLRGNLSPFALGGNLKPAIKQIGGVFSALSMVRGDILLEAMAHILANPKKTMKFIRESSAAMDVRMQSTTLTLSQLHKQNASDALLKAKNIFGKMADASYLPLTYADVGVAGMAWYGGYLQEMKISGNHDLAVRMGDKAMRRTQNDNSFINLTHAERNSEIVRMFNIFTNQSTKLFNTMVDANSKLRHGVDRQQAYKDFASAYLAIGGNAALTMMVGAGLFGLLKPIREPDEWVREMTGSVLGSIPLAKPTADFLIKQAIARIREGLGYKVPYYYKGTGNIMSDFVPDAFGGFIAVFKGIAMANGSHGVTQAWSKWEQSKDYEDFKKSKEYANFRKMSDELIKGVMQMWGIPYYYLASYPIKNWEEIIADEASLTTKIHLSHWSKNSMKPTFEYVGKKKK